MGSVHLSPGRIRMNAKSTPRRMKVAMAVLCFGLCATAFPSGPTLSLPDTWPEVCAHRVSPPEARRLNIYMLDRYAPLGSLPYRLAIALGLSERRKMNLVGDACWAGPVWLLYNDGCRNMEYWWVVEPHPVLTRLLPGIRLYVSPNHTLIPFRAPGNAEPAFGPGESPLPTFGDALVEAGAVPSIDNLPQTAQLSLLLGSAFRDLDRTDCFVGEPIVDTNPRPLVFRALTVRRIDVGYPVRDTMTDPHCPDEVRIDYKLLYRSGDGQYGEIPERCVEGYLIDTLWHWVGDVSWISVQNREAVADEWDVLGRPGLYDRKWSLRDRTGAVLHVIFGPGLRRLDDLRWRWRGLTSDVERQLKDANWVLSVVRVFAWVLVAVLLLALLVLVWRLALRRRPPGTKTSGTDGR